jgi:molybdopterin converting factor small subunit
VVTALFFGPLVDLAGCRRDELAGRTIDELVLEAQRRYGDAMASALHSCSIWVDGEPIARDVEIPARSEVAFLPPVSGG